ncbi:hypothetical protein LINPERPRIM_LOCUS37277 [Linum perenne]
MRVLVPLTQNTTDTIKTKFKTFKGKFQAQLDLTNASGMGWDETKNIVFATRTSSQNGLRCMSELLIVNLLCNLYVCMMF